MRRRTLLAPALALAFALGCAAQQEEAMSREEAPTNLDEARAGDSPAEPSAAPAAEAEDEPAAPRSLDNLDDVERELAANEARLQALGVSLRGADTREDRKTESSKTSRERKDQPNKKSNNQPNKKKPSTQGAPRPSAPPADGAGPSGGGAGKSTKPKQDVAGGEDLDDAVQPDAAKATPLSPNSQQQDAATRCMSICDLSQITCELSAQVCELAGRHDDEDDYRSACERAGEDCEVAQEACNDCK